MPQEPYLYDVSVAENIRYGRPGASQEDIINAAKLANAHDFIMELKDGYETRVGNAETCYPVVNARELPLPELF